MIKEYRILAFFMSAILLLSVSCSSQKQHDADYSRMKDLEHSFAFSTIVKELNNYQWGKQNDPRMLMLYCEALVESNQDLAEFPKKNSLPEYQKVFATGYYKLLSGNYRDAVAKFADLTGTEEGRIWGYIGILEYALYTQNITSLVSPLARLMEGVAKNPSSVPSWVIPYYRAWYAYYTFDFPQMRKILEEQRSNKEFDDITELTLKIRLLIKDNNLKAAEETFNNLSEPVAHYQSIIAAWSDIIEIRRGPEEAARFLDQKHRQYPLAWKIEQKYAQALIETGQVQAGLDLLKKLAERRPFDLMLQLHLAKYLLSRERGKGVKDIFYKLQNPMEIPFYNTLWAMINIKLGHEKEARERIDLAREVYPKCPNATWLTFWLEKRKHIYKKAEQALIDILDLDPNDVEALGYLMEVNYLMGKHEDVISIANRIKESGRFVPTEVSDKISSYEALGRINKGKVTNNIVKRKQL